ncbi:unnamed protein product [Dicrocoelium dendriticum]|nr:unnamed protein product [Dicrocoelium dendriticum]
MAFVLRATMNCSCSVGTRVLSILSHLSVVLLTMFVDLYFIRIITAGLPESVSLELYVFKASRMRIVCWLSVLFLIVELMSLLFCTKDHFNDRNAIATCMHTVGIVALIFSIDIGSVFAFMLGLLPTASAFVVECISVVELFSAARKSSGLTLVY